MATKITPEICQITLQGMLNEYTPLFKELLDEYPNPELQTTVDTLVTFAQQILNDPSDLVRIDNYYKIVPILDTLHHLWDNHMKNTVEEREISHQFDLLPGMPQYRPEEDESISDKNYPDDEYFFPYYVRLHLAS